MYQVFSVPSKNGDEKKREIAILHWEKTKNPYYVLHKLGLEYALSPKGEHLRGTGLSYGELFNYLTPEMLAPYDIEIMWPEREAARLENSRQVVTCFEIWSHLDAQVDNRIQTQRIQEVAGRYARKLERLKAEQHPVISTWEIDAIVSRAISWAGQCTRIKGQNVDMFFDAKVKEAKPHKVKKAPMETASGDGEQNIPQTA